MIVRTQSGSNYELDQDNLRIRRLSNAQGHGPISLLKDGEWQTYASLAYPPEVGMRLCVQFDPDDDDSMITTAVVEIVDDEIE